MKTCKKLDYPKSYNLGFPNCIQQTMYYHENYDVIWAKPQQMLSCDP